MLLEPMLITSPHSHSLPKQLQASATKSKLPTRQVTGLFNILESILFILSFFVQTTKRPQLVYIYINMTSDLAPHSLPPKL